MITQKFYLFNKACFGMTANAEQVMDTDVVVVGAGASGSAAAYALTEQGLKVINLEKLPQTGGHRTIFGRDICGRK
ncbi:FAD-dependent oxidoreductase [Symbiopectobacterium sp. RP]|uniref:FAD-dependent oxidoreductase n=1 Tax=Symbiopectobacterium sp. RP TaxID=3248553 RepID=UPI003D2E1A90